MSVSVSATHTTTAVGGACPRLTVYTQIIYSTDSSVSASTMPFYQVMTEDNSQPIDIKHIKNYNFTKASLACVHACMCVPACVCLHVCMPVCMHVCTCMCVRAYLENRIVIL